MRIIQVFGPKKQKMSIYELGWGERIVIDPEKCNGRPIINGTRVSVESILEYLAAGDSPEDILEEFPQISRQDVEACLAYASKIMGNRFILEKSNL